MELNLNPMTVDSNGLTEFPSPRMIRQIIVYCGGKQNTNDIVCEINDDPSQRVSLGNGINPYGAWFDVTVRATSIRVYGLVSDDHLTITYETL